MSQVSMGQVLLRNVIWHTDAHSKLQEELEKWRSRWKMLTGGPKGKHGPVVQARPLTMVWMEKVKRLLEVKEWNLWSSG